MVIGKLREIWRYPVKSMAGERLGRCSVTSTGIPGDRGWALRDETLGEIRGAKRWPVLLQCTPEYCSEPADGRIPAVVIRLPDGATTRSDAPDCAARLSELVGQRVTFWPIQPPSNKAHYRRGIPGAALLGFMVRSRFLRPIVMRLLPLTPLKAQLRAELSREPDEPIPNIAEFPADLFEFASPPGTYFDAFPIHLLTTGTLESMARVNPAAAWDVRRFRPNFVIETLSGADAFPEVAWCGRALQIGKLRVQCAIPTVRCGMTMHAQHDLPKDPTVLRSIVRDANQNLGVYASVIADAEVAVGDSVELCD